MPTVERSVLKIDRPEAQQGMTPQHRVRPLMPAAMRGDFAATDPFLATALAMMRPISCARPSRQCAAGSA